MASTVYSLASSWTSPTTFGRPPGFPLFPFSNFGIGAFSLRVRFSVEYAETTPVTRRSGSSGRPQVCNGRPGGGNWASPPRAAKRAATFAAAVYGSGPVAAPQSVSAIEPKTSPQGASGLLRRADYWGRC